MEPRKFLRKEWIMLVMRTLLFISIQAVFAFVFWLTGSGDGWTKGADMWPLGVVLTNLICVFLLIRLFRLEGKRYLDIFQIQKQSLKNDLLIMFGILIIAVPVSMLPNIVLAGYFFGSPETALGLLLRPLPMWAAIAGLILFPLTQGLAEIPVYFSYIMPKLKEQGMSPWLALSLPAIFLGAQHIAIPLLFNTRFILWRLLMFMPFAFLVGIVMNWRPRLLPYLAILHILMDVSFAVMLLGAAY